MPDVGKYLEGGGFADQVNERAATALAEVFNESSERRVLLISHGLGSIAAFHALHRLSGTHPAVKLNTWITLGSPLADETVKRSLPTQDLTNLVNWFNIAAEDDFVCHDETVANDYEHMLQDRHISRLEDYQIYNMAVRYGKVAPHNALGYLIHPRTTQLVAEWLETHGAAPDTLPAGR